jgi:ABC-2 type transport system ATP-binding protein
VSHAEATADPGRPAISIERVRKSYGSTAALTDVTFDVRTGQMFGVIGPDGAGKTTLLRLMCGLLAPDRGQVRVFGDDPFRTHRAATAAIGYVSQQFSLYGDLSVDENIEFFAQLHGVRDFAARRQRLLELTGLERFRSRLTDRLSGGMKQKLALACTLVHQPPLLVLDEPTTGVDPVSRREFWKLLAEFVAAGLTVVLATPYLDEAERCTRIVMLHEGCRLALDEPAHLQSALDGIVLEIVVDAPRRALEVLAPALGVDRLQIFGDRLHARVDREEAGQTIRGALEQAGLAPVSVRRVVPSLEDVFIDLLAEARPAQPPSPRMGTSS